MTCSNESEGDLNEREVSPRHVVRIGERYPNLNLIANAKSLSSRTR